ncbi:tRNA (adenosine(37)-N6)-threonylcarbamoyltransferase complex dimerization subunit type 1 TsaB [Paenarthrobacter sp. DKR-5]|uniref:tRNA (adenosine(37)-N6)-threonylcarbamoyltransferase complex dimerization subunit type 1 TsaB n=1 Tax=Paenarthrobacter sp. DKR-5 TaxID=2835535 RepID=UPI001BDC6D88|nr:tRNA (adenosine(37)-N6)-threonylcarbamoyltransferase complex dimerization subunit type 1 TsaB [Paenarthrobacter sp. DKR-5]MBT1001025.1 tRNA (adenosine(37)-N6)-threonylcarbamoyltransferase complex dimerization subunit type 1 TsaB [Paenarthrobacter sp. DKR-5]
MLILTIDTSAIASAALLSAGDDAAEVLATFATEDTRSHAEVLAPGIRRMLDDAGVPGARLGLVLTGVGPGPFTGLRSGIATARTLAFAWDKPLAGVMSLDAVAWDVVAAGAAVSDFVVATDARRKELYWAQYAADGTRQSGPHVTAPSELPALPVHGAGAGLYAQQLEAQGSSVPEAFARTQPTAASLGLSAAAVLRGGGRLADSSPLYLRESDAQVPGPRKRAL